MIETYDKIISDALSLPPAFRVVLAEQLLESLDRSDTERIERLWASEIERRVKEYEEEKATVIPGEEVFRRIRERKRNAI